MAKPIIMLDAPSNLGLRPPEPGAVPGVYKLAGALRDQHLLERLDAQEGGVVTPPRYLSAWDGKTVRNGAAIAAYAHRLADRIQSLSKQQKFILVLGGDCSILLGPMLALRRDGPYGLVYIDGHLDFRHPGNSETLGAAAGEDLALVTGRGDPDLPNLEGLKPLVRDSDVVALSFRPHDECAHEIKQAGMTTFEIEQIQQDPARVGQAVVVELAHRSLAGYWIHLDVDVLDPSIMPAVDTPEPGGLSLEELVQLLHPLLASELAIGMEITVFDPDLDPDGRYAQQLTAAIVAAFKTDL
ncbi:arginase [Dictyobacter sp. S3.2.2.5]|uniref:Arginase n=1 Tax=Dictyobacter halimunensis TaxID=3026934 RepID=A0ABQ6FSN5_9CHLR|nr:arginase [Dictyobacter sp. S3.2.2.5]